MSRGYGHAGSEYGPVDLAPCEDAVKLIASLRPDQVQAIDTVLLSACDHHRRKVAWAVGALMGSRPDSFCAARVAEMVALGRLEAQGDLSRMRYSEVRLAAAGVRLLSR
ncbi:DUF3658 domain-containing protein [Lysobacter gummosus]|uniref:DUF3658 domain-containing protein n=1 Tax=Lysobacter gummosus TaxID=262324 RepID=UPI0009F8DC94